MKSGFAYANGGWRRLKAIRAFQAGQWRVIASFAPTISATANPTFVTGTAYTPSPSLVTTSPVTAVVSGGIGPYTYSWTIVEQSVATTISSPTSATVSFSQFLYNETGAGRAECVITDRQGNMATCVVDFTLIGTDFS